MKEIVLLLVLCVSQISCTITQLKPWERDILARENMQLDYDEQVDTMDEQVYYSKEASFGGRGIGGGGCGCN